MKKLNKDYSSMDITVQAYDCNCSRNCDCEGSTTANISSHNGAVYSLTSYYN